MDVNLYYIFTFLPLKMSIKKEVVIIISELELYLIDKVRELRGRATPYVSQVELSLRMEYAEGYVGKVENFSSNSKYNVRNLNLIANALKLKSYSDLLPVEVLKNDLIEVRLELTRNNDKVEFDENDIVIKNYKIKGKRILTSDEIKEYNNRRRSKK
ncbi:hypothetical protein SAMN05421741_11370 [Paenimyroides ummariense]|uniref:Uncharacterized protein n=2 Tax=Paenimyroides ummariense TaxID=913024 RepID=A0A1I5CUP3_9FLAO|nr:hypothetical protein SAMN05421741_11370 [Paenimyroides ummariense]